MTDTAALEALGVSAAEGLAYCADDAEFYAEMLAEYVSESQGNAAHLQRFFEGQDWENYRIRVHSLKNTSRMIGAAALSEKAFALETAAKEQNVPKLLTEHSAFLTAYRALTKGLREMIG